MNTSNTNINSNNLGDIDSIVVSTQNEKDGTIQSSSNPPPPPPKNFLQKIRSMIQRLNNSLSFTFKRKLLRNIRLLLLALAFTGLILDAITISFEVNVMGLVLSDISEQTALLLVPDVLAILMALFLLIYTSEAICCCFGITDDNDGDDDDFNQFQERQYDQDTTNAQNEFWSTELENRNAVNRQEDENEMERSAGQSFKQKGRKQETETIEDEYEEELTRNRRNRVSFVNYPELAHRTGSPTQYTLSNTPTITITTPLNINTSNNHNNNHHRNNNNLDICTDNSISPNNTTSHTQVYTHSPTASIDVPTSPSTSNNDASRTASILNAASLSPSEPVTTISSTKPMRSRKFLLIYIIFRIIFSLGLFCLAIYWPARRLKPPPVNGGTPPTYPHAQDGHRKGNFLGNNTGVPFGLGARNSYPQRGVDGLGGDDDGDDRGQAYGLRHWCALEQTFGDNQSAIVYCRVKTIRPGITYAWAALIIVELGIAALAGDFSRDRGRRSSRMIEPDMDINGAEGRNSNYSDEYEDEELGNTSSGAEMTEHHNNNRVSDTGFSTSGQKNPKL